MHATISPVIKASDYSVTPVGSETASVFHRPSQLRGYYRNGVYQYGDLRLTRVELEAIFPNRSKSHDVEIEVAGFWLKRSIGFTSYAEARRKVADLRVLNPSSDYRIVQGV